MNPKSFALISGIFLFALGALALLPGMVGSLNGLPPLNIETSYGQFMNFMPLNILNKILLMGMGLLGMFSARALGRELPYSISYSRLVFALMGTLALMGLYPPTSTFFGYVPLFGANSLLYGSLSLIGAWFGFALTSRVPVDRTGRHPTRESLAH